MGRPPCCDKSNVKRGLWTAEEDAKILVHVATHGTGNWTSVPKKAGLKRCGKSCRLRWTNYLRPDLKHESFTPQEEDLIVRLHHAFGSRWSLIAGQLPGRTDNDVKNYWNTKLRKKLFGMGIDPVTHKPFSQILADYENIGGLLGGSSHVASLNRDLKNAVVPKSEQSPPLQGFPSIKSHSIMPYSTPMTGLIQDSHLNHNSTNTHSMDLLAQLQAVRLFTEASKWIEQEITESCFLTEGSSSSSSSSNLNQVSSPPSFPCQSSSLQTTPSSPFSWNEFLLEDAFLPLDPQPLPQDSQESSFTGSPSKRQNEALQSEFINEYETNSHEEVEMGYGTIDSTEQGYSGTSKGEANNVFGVSASSNNLFVEAILDQDNEMLWEFPELLGEPFYN